MAVRCPVSDARPRSARASGDAGDQTGDSVMGTTQQASGSGNVRITVTSNGKLTPIKSTQSSIDSNLNWGIVGAPDANGHYNDCVVFLNWPIK